jgi:hypothetical protein
LNQEFCGSDGHCDLLGVMNRNRDRSH